MTERGLDPCDVEFLEDIAENKGISNSYDYVAVFPVKNEKIASAAQIFLTELKQKDYELYCFLSVQGNELFVLFKCPLSRLQHFAAATNYRMELDPKIARQLCEAGFPDSKIAPIEITSDNIFSSLDPYQYIYGRYATHLPLDVYRKSKYVNDPFKRSNRLKLIYYMIQAPAHEGGMNYPIEKMLKKNKILALYPLHDKNSLEILTKNWLNFCQFPWNQPINLIKEYFGEKIGLYFSFMGIYTQALIFPSILGIICQIIVWKTGNWSHPIIPFYSLFISIWVVIFLELWKRQQKDLSLKWGTQYFEEEEPDRPEFTGEPIRSYINGKPTIYFPPRKQTFLMCQSTTVINFLVVMVIGVVSAIYVLRFRLYVSIGGNASIVASALNSVQIVIFNMIYNTIAVYLNNYENHRTATAYDDSLITKLFIFQFVNSYASFYFLAFIAPYIARPSHLDDDGSEGDYVGECGASDCMIPLSVNLGIIFFMNLTVNNVIEVVVPIIMNKLKTKSETKGTQNSEKLSLPERQYLLQEYDVGMNVLKEYAETAVQFGLMTVFISALPIATLIAFIYNAFEIKLDAWKLLKVYQRPIPKIAEDWGAWEHVFSILAIVGVVTNAGLICFTMKSLDGWSQAARLWIFIGYQWILFLFMYFIALLIPDESNEYKIQSKRAEFIVSKLIDRVPDDDEESEKRALLNEMEDDNDNPQKSMTDGVNLSSVIRLSSYPIDSEEGGPSSPSGTDSHAAENLLTH